MAFKSGLVCQRSRCGQSKHMADRMPPHFLNKHRISNLRHSGWLENVGFVQVKRLLLTSPCLMRPGTSGYILVDDNFRSRNLIPTFSILPRLLKYTFCCLVLWDNKLRVSKHKKLDWGASWAFTFWSWVSNSVNHSLLQPEPVFHIWHITEVDQDSKSRSWRFL